MKLGAFQLGDLPVDIDHVFASSADLGWVPAALQRSRAAGRTPLVTVEPWSDLGQLPATLPSLGPCYLRYGHECNGGWYPWSKDPARLQREWRALRFAAPDHVRLVWGVNIGFPGSAPLAAYWPGDAIFSVIGLDGYDRINGAPPRSFRQLFAPSLDAVRPFGPDLPRWVCETATPRLLGAEADTSRQKPWAIALRADAPGLGVDAVVWFNADKPDGRWALSPNAARAFTARGQ
jgi:hypothetical protein